MFKHLRDYLARLLLAPLAAHFRVLAVIEVAECKAEILRRARQADDDQQPDLARQLREYAATMGIECDNDRPFALPEPSGNGHAPPLPAAKKPTRSRKEMTDESQR